MRKRYRILGILATFLISGGISSIFYSITIGIDKSTWGSAEVILLTIAAPIIIFLMFLSTGLAFFVDNEPKTWK